MTREFKGTYNVTTAHGKTSVLMQNGYGICSFADSPEGYKAYKHFLYGVMHLTCDTVYDLDKERFLVGDVGQLSEG